VFWFQLVELKLNYLHIEPVNQLNTALTSLEDKKDPKKNIIELKNTKEIFSMFKSKIKNIFKSDQVIKLEEQRKNDDISKQKKEKQGKDILIVYKVLENFIGHFANFSLDISHAIDIIVDIATKYNVPSEKISYFVTQINTSIFSVKSRNFYILFDNKNSRRFDVSLKKLDAKSAIVMHSGLYLANNQFLNILMINKSINKNFQKMIFKKCLLENKNLTMKMRLAIWYRVLKIVRLYYNC